MLSAREHFDNFMCWLFGHKPAKVVRSGTRFNPGYMFIRCTRCKKEWIQ